jgi:hypothetical protein
MLLPLPQTWPVRCAACGHRGEVNAALGDLAAKVLACRACGHRQAFEPATVVRSSKAGNGWRARRYQKHVGNRDKLSRRKDIPARDIFSRSPVPSSTSDLPSDRLDDLWAAG